MLIEKPKQKDLQEINKIALDIHEQHIAYRPDIFKKVDSPMVQEYFDELLANDEIFVSKENGLIMGYIIIKNKETKNPICFYRKTILVEVLAIKNDCRSKGIGRQLMEFAKNLAKQKNCTDIELTVSPENTDAIRFYEKLGMTVKNIKHTMKI